MDSRNYLAYDIPQVTLYSSTRDNSSEMCVSVDEKCTKKKWNTRLWGPICHVEGIY